MALTENNATSQGETRSRSFGWLLALGCALVATICGLLAVASFFVTATGALGAGFSEYVSFHLPTTPKWVLEFAAAFAVMALYLLVVVRLVRHADRVRARSLPSAGPRPRSAPGWILDNATAYNGFADSRQLTQYAQESPGMTTCHSARSEAIPRVAYPATCTCRTIPSRRASSLSSRGTSGSLEPKSPCSTSSRTRLPRLAPDLRSLAWHASRGHQSASVLWRSCSRSPFVPPLVFCIFPYGNALGLALCLFAMLAWMKSQAIEGTRALPLILFGAILLFFGFVAKSTYVVMAIGFVLVLAIDSVRKSSWWRAPHGRPARYILKGCRGTPRLLHGGTLGSRVSR